MNKQKIQKLNINPSGILDVHSVFYTIQGEGPFAGRPAVFIRLSGCNLRCPLCDTDYTGQRRPMWPNELVERVKATNRAATLVVITGGEPFRQNMIPFVLRLLDSGYTVQIETNGTLYHHNFPYDRVTVVCSPKTGKLAAGYYEHPEVITAFKYVTQAGKIDGDGLPTTVLEHSATPHVARPPEGFEGEIFLQPADEIEEYGNGLIGTARSANNMDACVQSCKQHGYTLGIQIHKLIGVE